MSDAGSKASLKSSQKSANSPVTHRQVVRPLSGSLSRRGGSGSPAASSPRGTVLGLDPSAGDIPDSVKRMRDMPAAQRIKEEWEIKQKKLRDDLEKKAARDRRCISPQVSRRNTIDQETSQRRASRITGTESSPRSDFDSPVLEDSSVWARNRQERFTYQYGNFEGAVPEYVPSKTMLRRAPAVGTYGKSTSVDA